MSKTNEVYKTITLKVELCKPTKEKQSMYKEMTDINTDFSNWLLDYEELPKATSKVFKEYSKTLKLPSSIINQTIRYVKSKKKHQKAKDFKNVWCVFNNQNSKLEFENGLFKVSFPTLSKRVGVPLVVTDFQKEWLDKVINQEAKTGAMELFNSKNKWYVNIPITVPIKKTSNVKVMGIDVGLKNIATCSVGTNSLLFKGREVTYIRRKYNSRRKMLGKLKKLKAIKKSKNKEARWMKSKNHQISREIVNYALTNGVGLIRMEDLTGIRVQRSSRKQGRSLNNWGFYQLQSFIQYKAEMEGLKVEYVNPKYTSQTCKCGHTSKKNREGISFKCEKCLYKNHADINASINIAKNISGISKKVS